MRGDDRYEIPIPKILKGVIFLVLFITTLTSCGWLHPHSQSFPYHDQGCSRWGPERMDPHYDQDRGYSGWPHGDMWGSGMMGPEYEQRMARHRAFMQLGTPVEYRGQKNPFSPSREVIEEGAELYHQQCAQCHGPKGMGDGEAGKSLAPSPALLAYMIQMPMAADEYLMWTVSEGGKQFGTAMPAFKEILPKDSIWKIISFMRVGFPFVTKHDNEQETGS